MHEHDPDPIADIQALIPSNDTPFRHRFLDTDPSALVGGARDYRVELLTDAGPQQRRRRGLAPAGSVMERVRATASGENSGCNPRSNIARRAMRFRSSIPQHLQYILFCFPTG